MLPELRRMFDATRKNSRRADRQALVNQINKQTTSTGRGGSRNRDVIALGLYDVIDQHTGYWGTSVDGFLEQFGRAMNHEASTILIHIDSPGGSSYGVQEASD